MGRNDRLRRTILGLALVAVTPLAAAQEETWSFVPRISTNLTWTDNIRLQPDAIAQEQAVLDVVPSFLLRRNSPRLNADFDYRLQSQFYDDSDLDKTSHYLRLVGSAAVVENSLFLDFRSSLTQQIIDPADRIALNTVSDTRNRTDVGAHSLYPNWRGNLGNFAQAQAGYRVGIVEYDEPDVQDSKEREARIQVSGNPSPTGLAWTLNYTDSTTEYDNHEELDLARTALTLSYPVTPKARVIVYGGVDDNDVGVATTQEIDGSFWQVGVSGRLGRYNEYEVRAGDHFYGDSYYARLRREGRLLNVQLEYNESVTTIGRDQLDYQSFLNFLTEVAGVELALTQTEVYVRKVMTLSGNYSLPKTSITGRLYTETRDYRTENVSVDDDDGILGANIGAKWNMSDRSELRADLTWRRFDLRSSQNEPEDTILRFTYKRRIGGGLDMTASVWRNKRGATIDVDEYTENAVSIGIGKSF